MVDIYTKLMLAIIALTLVVLTAHDILHSARAQISFSRVQICDMQNCTGLFPYQANVTGRGVVTLWALPVASVR